jgi:2-polyprenyl-6-methoxyphenol hydroxylase-like FAD-dependent oxidoreductase
MSRTIVIAGGGIGGLTAALLLDRAGWNTVVLERTDFADRDEDLRAHGSGLSLFPNGTAVLAPLGVFDRLPPQVVEISELCFRTKEGGLIRRDDYDEIRARFGHPVFPVGRSDLFLALAETYGRERIRWGQQVARFTDTGSRVVVETSGGDQVIADALIGADGLHSAVRRQLLGSETPRYRGTISWRGLAPHTPEGMTVGSGGNSWGRGDEVGWMPMIDGRVYWYASALGAEDELQGLDGATLHAQVLDRFGSYHRPFPDLVRITAPETLIGHALYDRAPVSTWGTGNVTLLGDAAHPMLPHIAQGANQAIEDAFVLAQKLGSSGDVARSLREYEQVRIPRTNAVAKRADQAGSSIHRDKPFQIFLRDRIAKFAMGRAGVRRWDPVLLGASIPSPVGA